MRKVSNSSWVCDAVLKLLLTTSSHFDRSLGTVFNSVATLESTSFRIERVWMCNLCFRLSLIFVSIDESRASVNNVVSNFDDTVEPTAASLF